MGITFQDAVKRSCKELEAKMEDRQPVCMFHPSALSADLPLPEEDSSESNPSNAQV